MPPPDTPTGRQIVVWRPPSESPEAIERREHEAKLLRARKAEVEARERAAAAQIKLTGAREIVADLVTRELKKWLEMSGAPEFAAAVGPLSPETILRLAEWVSKENRLDGGKATENIAHLVRPAIDFSKLTQEERNAWRALAIKGGTPNE
jgi:hypothetical protein